MSLASLTSPPVAAYLCPDSVLVAEDGTVLFGLPPVNGGYAAWAHLRGCVPALPGGRRRGELSWALCFSLLGTYSAFFLAPEVAEQKLVTEKVSAPPPFPVAPAYPPSDATPPVQRSCGGWWERHGLRGSWVDPKCSSYDQTPGFAWPGQHPHRSLPGTQWLWQCHPETGLLCGQLQAGSVGLPEPTTELSGIFARHWLSCTIYN